MPDRTWNGADLCLLNEGAVFDPTIGWTFSSEYVGTKEAVDAFLLTVNPYNVRVSRTVQDAQHFLTLQTVTPPEGTGGEEVPVDTYEISTEYESTDIWANPNVQSRTLLPMNSENHLDCLAKFRRFCETRMKDLYDGYITIAEEKAGTKANKIAIGKGPTPSTSTGLLLVGGGANTAAMPDFNYGDANSAARVINLAGLHWQFMMGFERWEVRRIALTRRRTTSVQYALRHIVEGTESIYTTAALIRDFDIPPEVGNRLPVDPTGPTLIPFGTKWGWRIRRQDSTHLGRSLRIEEQLDWVYASWSLELYNFIV